MIDIQKAKKAFKEYVKKYNPEDGKIKLKIAHIERTANMARKIAESLELGEEDIKLAELIGLLHDIGRFEQIKKFQTFDDNKSINHGEYGVFILFEEGKIRDYIEDSRYDNIIKKAILNHNRNKIEDGLTDRELLHAKIVRDADKTDIFFVVTIEDLKTLFDKEDLSEEIISDEIYREFVEDRKIEYKNRKTNADNILSQFAYLYDFNFSYGLKYVLENQYIEKYHQRFHFKDEKTNKRYQEVYRIIIKYVKKQLLTNNN